MTPYINPTGNLKAKSPFPQFGGPKFIPETHTSLQGANVWLPALSNARSSSAVLACNCCLSFLHSFSVFCPGTRRRHQGASALVAALCCSLTGRKAFATRIAISVVTGRAGEEVCDVASWAGFATDGGMMGHALLQCAVFAGREANKVAA
eukprot:1147360-Pelagomonas_calceolata.AAC.1